MLKVRNLDKTYRVGTFGTDTVRAVSDVSFTVADGEIVSLIGESGSGKSTIGKLVLRLIDTTNGLIEYDGADITELKGRKLKEFYRHAQGVFQDPFSSYNPIFKVDRAFETVRLGYFRGVSHTQWRTKVEDSLRTVGLEPDSVLGKYPHQLSGGQLQRLLIARALLLDVKLLVADEIISMLDASTRIDILNLLGKLRQRGLGILFVTHDLSLGNYVSDKVVILYKGRVVESGRTSKVFGSPLHPYTRDLLASVPQLDRKWEDVEAEEAVRAESLRNRCLYHEHPEVLESDSGLMEVDNEHLVGCFAMGQGDPCPLQLSTV